MNSRAHSNNFVMPMMSAFRKSKHACRQMLYLLRKSSNINAVVDEQKRHLDGLILKSKRPTLGASQFTSLAQMEHKAGFINYVRSGDENDLRQLEEKAMSYGSDPDGGYLVPDETATEIGRRLAMISPIRSIAGARQVSASIYKKPFAQSGPAVGWVSETALRPETNSPSLAELQFPTMELYAMPAATPTLLEDRRRRCGPVDC